MFYTVYKITNKVNKKIYIGVHRTTNIQDGYMGSGTVLKKAQNKYGIENFEKEILEVFDNPEDMFEMESKLVNKDFVSRRNTYNLSEGGNGYWSQEAKDNLLWLMENDSEWRNTWLIKHSESKKRLYKNKKHNRIDATLTNETKTKISNSLKDFYKENPDKATFLGKHHSEKAKRKIGIANSKHQSGKGNSQFGTMWVHSLIEKRSKKIKKEDFTDWETKGWLKGRKMKF